MYPFLREESLTAPEGDLNRELLAAYGGRPGFAVLRGSWPEHFGLPAGSLFFLEPLCDRSAGLDVDLDLVAQGNGCPVPFSCGFFCYELLHAFEQVERAKLDSLRLPAHQLWRYAKLLYVPAQSGAELKLFSFKYEDQNDALWQAEGLRSLLKHPSARSSDAQEQRGFPLALGELKSALAPFSNFTPESYAQAVSMIRNLIAQGEVYQVNLSQKFCLPFRASAQEYYQELQRLSPAKYSALLAASEFSIVSSSPELFVASRAGDLTCSPIKGTRARFLDVKLDRQAELELLSSEKDRAELAMIVDLTRNDLGRVSKIGSVKVQNHARLEKLAQVQHLVSDVRGNLADKLGLKEVLNSLFPCGSITGCPKIAAMKYINMIEGQTRGIYTGSIGCFAGSRDFVLNVAIRSALIKSGFLTFQTGGGVVYDSNPLKEYEETLVKAAGLYRAYLALESQS